MFRNLSLADYTTALASNAPTPGGGAAVCVSMAQAAALTGMVSRKSLDALPQTADRLWVQLRSADRLRDDLLDLADVDADAFESLLAACDGSFANLSNAPMSPEILDALVHAASVPLEASELGVELLRMCGILRDIGKPHLGSDLEVAALLARACITGASHLVRSNADLLPESPRLNEIRTRLGAVQRATSGERA